MCADFNYYLNRQGAPGLQGEKGDKGDKGDSITVSTGVNTPTEYTLIFDKGDGNSFETGNLKYPMRDDGGTYLRYDRTNNTVVLGYPNIAELNGNVGEVQLATTVTVGNNTVQNKDAVSYELFKSVKDSTDSELTSLDGRVTYLEQHGGGGGGGTTFTPGAGLDMTPDNVLYVETDSTIKVDQETNELGVIYANGLDRDLYNGALIAKVDGTTITYDNDGALTAIGGGGTVDAYTKAETDTLLANKITTTAPTSPLEWLPDTSQNIIMSGFPTGQTTVTSQAGSLYRASSYATVLGLWDGGDFTDICYSPSIVNTSSAPYIEVDISSLNIGGTIFSYYDGNYPNTRAYGYVLGYEDNNSFIPVLTISPSKSNNGISLCYIKESGGESSSTVGYKDVLTYSVSFDNSYFMFSSNQDYSTLTLAGGKYTGETYKDDSKQDISVSQYFNDADASTRIAQINKVRIYSTTVFSGSSYYSSTLDLSKVKFINPTTTTTNGDETTRKALFDSSDNILDAHLEQLNLKYDSNTLGVNSNNELYGKIGDGTITLTQGTTTLGTFSVNQSGNTSINIPASGGGGGTSYAAGDGIDISASDVISAKVDGTTIGIDSSTKEIKLLSSIPTDTSDLTNGAGYITGITSGDVTTALGYTPYSSSNPDGYTSNVGTVTSVNNTQPDSDGNVTLSIPDTTNMVTTNTTQTISGSKTFGTETHHQGVITFDSALGTPIIRGTSGSNYRNMITRSNTYSTVTTGNTSDNLILKGALTRPKYSHDSSDGNYLALYSDIPGDMTGASSSTAGTKGLVPAPAAGDDTKFLAGDGTWKNISGANTDLSNITNSAKSIISNQAFAGSDYYDFVLPNTSNTMTFNYDGYISLAFRTTVNGICYIHMIGYTETSFVVGGAFTDLHAFKPVTAGETVEFRYGGISIDPNSGEHCRFYYSKGAYAGGIS